MSEATRTNVARISVRLTTWNGMEERILARYRRIR
jgi:hypothetical protein